MNPLTETWQIHSHINLYLLENIDETSLSCCRGFWLNPCKVDNINKTKEYVSD